MQMKTLRTFLSRINIGLFITMLAIIIPSTGLAATTLSVDKNQIHINENENYALINLKIFEDGKQVTWKAKDALKASENIIISNTDKTQYGYKNNKELLFIPLGISENDYEYQLIVMPSRQVFIDIKNISFFNLLLLSY